MKKCYIYARTATATQLERSKGQDEAIARQLDECRNYARKYGYNVIEAFTDAGCSGRNTKRKALQRLLKHSKKQTIDAVFILNVARLSRNAVDFAEINAKLRKKDIKLISIHEGDLSSTTGSRFTGNILASVAQYELERSKGR